MILNWRISVLSGKGLIIRREVIDKTTGCGIKLNLGVLFMEELNFLVTFQ